MKILHKQKDAKVISTIVKRQHGKNEKKSICSPLRERHNMMHNIKEIKIEVGDLVLIKDEEKSNRKWSIGIDEELYKS